MAICHVFVFIYATALKWVYIHKGEITFFYCFHLYLTLLYSLTETSCLAVQPSEPRSQIDRHHELLL